MGKRKDKRKAKRKARERELVAMTFLAMMALRHRSKAIGIDMLIAHKASEKAKAAE